MVEGALSYFWSVKELSELSLACHQRHGRGYCQIASLVYVWLVTCLLSLLRIRTWDWCLAPKLGLDLEPTA